MTTINQNPMAHVLNRIVDRLIPIFREEPSRSFATDLTRDVVAMVTYIERGTERCYWSCYGSGSVIRPPDRDGCVPHKVNTRTKQGEDASLWFDSGNNAPVDVFEVDLVRGTVKKLKHITDTFAELGSYAEVRS